MLGAVPAPETVIVCGLVPLLSKILIVPCSVPGKLGENVTRIWQLWPRRSGREQLWRAAKSALALTSKMNSAEEDWLVMKIAFGTLEVSTT